MLPPLVIRGMWGLGDNIYQRPFVRAACRRAMVYLETPWPELYEDLPVRFLRADRRLRTQTRNVRRQPVSRWSVAPSRAREIRVGYGAADLAAGSIVRKMEKLLPLGGADRRAAGVVGGSGGEREQHEAARDHECGGADSGHVASLDRVDVR